MLKSTNKRRGINKKLCPRSPTNPQNLQPKDQNLKHDFECKAKRTLIALTSISSSLTLFDSGSEKPKTFS